MDPRQEFLLRMYDQMWNNISRHILVVWQSVGVLIGGFAVFALVEKKIFSLDLATTLIVLTSAWLIAHVIDANYWYDRNLLILANIERQFLKPSDLRHIHPYFSEHRKAGDLLDHLQIQFYLGIAICSVVVLFHFWKRVLPGFGLSLREFDVERALPYAVLLLGGALLFHFNKTQRGKYMELLQKAPGVEIQNRASSS